ncbi:hypothetical protein EVAR_3941_1 [Eumeta japonica]|uniref:Uncharacterized protein n=1 Tax=Eumeta variegata TaxID=151549 RepID=A0A4C1STL9_EUMVA|nr:hypothetical protein EVAR_3941_1 [Eumeta japonica]
MINELLTFVTRGDTVVKVQKAVVSDAAHVLPALLAAPKRPTDRNKQRPLNLGVRHNPRAEAASAHHEREGPDQGLHA